MISTQAIPRFNLRTLFVSDVHLGSKHSQTVEFLAYLQRYTPEELYLVGDFIDGWKLQSRWHWPEVCSQVLQRLAELSRRGTTIYYASGNHDDFLRHDRCLRSLAETFGGVLIGEEFIHTTAAGKRLLVIHGDRFDCVEHKARWLSQGASFAYDFLLSANRLISRWRNKPGTPYEFASAVKRKVKCGVRFLSSFEDRMFEYTRKQQCDGVICGHIHTPGVWNKSGLDYYNTGDWVEHCTALIEHFDGRLELENYYQPATRPPQPEPGAIPHELVPQWRNRLRRPVVPAAAADEQ